VRPDKVLYRGDFRIGGFCGRMTIVHGSRDVRDGTGFARLRAEPKEKAPFVSKLDTLPGEPVADQLRLACP